MENITFEDGSRLVVSPVYRKEEAASTEAAENTITRFKDVDYVSSDGTLEWKYTLEGEFSYEYGVSSVCTRAGYFSTIYGDKWTFSNGSSYASGNTAHGEGNYKKKELFIVTRDVDVDITLTCDIYGNVE